MLFEAFDLPQWFHVVLLLVAVFMHFLKIQATTQVGLEVSGNSKSQKHKTVVEGQRLRKANIMEGNAFFLENMSKKSVESRGDTDVRIVLFIPFSLFHSG